MNIQKEQCNEHSGNCAKINGLEKSEDLQWVEINKLKEKVNSIYVGVVSGAGSFLAVIGYIAYRIIDRSLK